ncbi:hypothetical protein CTI12_AA150510 [Artemisia annua]|uniref:DUF4216 domain-containing protein n=1 Tax=Artemisia annua TaxID=35608 RepID=A0A2U1PHW2_ARTAN|nr:hypothetical protein CTI12_AA150510 [Artemisia annua]
MDIDSTVGVVSTSKDTPAVESSKAIPTDYDTMESADASVDQSVKNSTVDILHHVSTGQPSTEVPTVADSTVTSVVSPVVTPITISTVEDSPNVSTDQLGVFADKAADPISTGIDKSKSVMIEPDLPSRKKSKKELELLVKERNCAPAHNSTPDAVNVLKVICSKNFLDANDPRCTPDLFALACGPLSTATSINSCVVNGVKFVVHSRDVKRTTQNSRICSPGEKPGEMYYGQLEDILEFSYTQFKVVLFRVKWFDLAKRALKKTDHQKLEAHEGWISSNGVVVTRLTELK